MLKMTRGLMGMVLALAMACAMANAADAAKPLVLLDEADTIAKWKGMEAVAEPVQSGKVAGLYEGAARGATAELADPPNGGDWSAYNVLKMDVFSGKANGSRVIITMTSPGENGVGDYYIITINVDWEGWKSFQFPLDRVGKGRSPKGWDSITRVTFHTRGWNAKPKEDTKLVFDAVRLEHVEMPKPTKAATRRKEPNLELAKWNGALKYVGFPWEKVFAQAAKDKESAARLRRVIQKADTVVSKPIRVRHYKLDDVPENQRDGRYKRAGKNAEVFVLAMYDCGTANHLMKNLVPVAIAYRETGEKKYLDYCMKQLRETATWVPFQRPGWTAYNPDRVLPEGGDGNWLATGNAINGVVETLNILGDSVPADLRARYREVLQGEADSIADDWVSKRPWFVKSDFPATNQWVLPSAGLVYACLYLGDEKNRDAYDMGIKNLARTALSQGDDGSWREGLSYGSFSAEHVFWAAWAARRAGDERLANYPFVKSYHNWITHMLMPGRYAVNAFDCGMSTMSNSPDESLMLDVMLTKAPAGFWSIQNLFNRLPATRLGLLFDYYVGNAAKSETVPPTYAFFPSQQVLTWRDSWNNRSAMGVWMRGGSSRDMHSHRDNGHVSLYNGVTAILIECGTCSYSDPDLNPKYANAAGHNILQIGEVSPRGRRAEVPITVGTLNDTGGEVSIDGTGMSTEAKSWIRKLSWSREGWLRVSDSVKLLQSQKPGTEFFRFHTAATLPLEISGSGAKWTAKWAAATITFETDRPVKVDQVKWPDKSGFGMHQCIRIMPTEAADALNLKTKVTFDRKKNALKKLPKYAAYLEKVKKEAGDVKPAKAFQRIEAEDMTGGDPRFTITDKKVNAKVCFLNWDYVGQRILTEFDAPADGFYQVMTRDCTGAVHGVPIRSLRIDGESPFEEAREIVFQSTGGFSNTTDDWEYRVLGEKQVKGGFRIYLPKGKHEIAMVCEDGGGLNLDYVVIYGAGMAKEKAIKKAQAME